jgi:hypothetical protein
VQRHGGTTQRRAGYGEQLIERLSSDLHEQFGRGFSSDNLEYMPRFSPAYPTTAISETASRKLTLTQLTQAFTLPWSAIVLDASQGKMLG